MSGLLRRMKRSRPVDAGEPPVEGTAAAPESGAAPQGEAAATPGAPAEGDPPRAWLTPSEPEQAAAETPAGETPKPEPKQPEAPKPVLVANPDTPAGLALENQTTPRPPAGRRGRLRRRLRYLRRARELMLRDLGGLLYEVHRSGGGNVDAHATVLTTKVQRISGLDAEAHALETALASSRPEALVFEPGIGGTCPNCGELFSSAAHFCANCGASVTDLPAPAAPAGQLTMDVEAATPTPAPTIHPLTQPERRRFWHKVVGGKSGAAAAASGAEDATRVIEPDGQQTEDAPAAETPGGDAPAEAPAGEAAAEAPAGEAAAEAPVTGAPADETPTGAPADTAAETPADTAAETPADTAAEAPAETGAETPAETGAETPGETSAAPADTAAEAPGAPAADEPSETNPERSNGRTDRTPSELSDGDPLVTRRSPS